MTTSEFRMMLADLADKAERLYESERNKADSINVPDDARDNNLYNLELYKNKMADLSRKMNDMLDQNLAIDKIKFREMMTWFRDVYKPLNEIRSAYPKFKDDQFKELQELESIISKVDVMGGMSLQDAIQDTRENIVKLDSDPDYMGRLSSQRFMMKVKNSDGKEVEGFFTVDRGLFDYDPDGFVKSILEAAKKEHSRDKELVDFVNNILNRPHGPSELLLCAKKKYENPAFALLDEGSYDVMDIPDSIAGFDPNLMDYMDIINVRDNVNFKDKFLKQNIVNSKNIMKLLAQVRRTLTEEEVRNINIETAQYHYCSDNGIRADYGSSKAGRNYALYKVAQLLGAADVIAKATPMTAEFNGKHYHGFFMEKGEGTCFNSENKEGMLLSDLGRMTKDSFGGEALEQLAKIQVIDYICQNVDRHTGNFLIKTDEKGKVTKITGIDNDLSFGKRAFGTYLTTQHGVSLDNICVIPKEMAEVIVKMDSHTVMGVLKDTGLTQAEITAVGKRFGKLQEYIKEARKNKVNVNEKYRYTESIYEIADKAITKSTEKNNKESKYNSVKEAINKQEKEEKIEPKNPIRGKLRIISHNDWKNENLDNLGNRSILEYPKIPNEMKNLSKEELPKSYKIPSFPVDRNNNKVRNNNSIFYYVKSIKVQVLDMQKDVKKDNTFLNNLEEIKTNYNKEGLKVGKVFKEAIKSKPVSTESLTEFKTLMEGYLDRILKTERWYQIKRTPYKSMVGALKKLLKEFPDEKMTMEEFSDFREKLADLEKKANQYIAYKTPKKETEYGVIRLKEVKSMAAYLKSYRKTFGKAYNEKMEAELDKQYQDYIRIIKTNRVLDAIVKGFFKYKEIKDDMAVSDVENIVKNSEAFKAMINPKGERINNFTRLDYYNRLAQENPKEVFEAFNNQIIKIGKDKASKNLAAEKIIFKEPNEKNLKQLKEGMRKEANAIENVVKKIEQNGLNMRKSLAPASEGYWAGASKSLPAGLINGLSLDRDAGQHICAGVLYLRGNSVGEILDTGKKTEEKQAVVNEVLKNFRADDKNWVVKTMYDILNKVSDELEQRFCALGNRVPAYTQQDLLKELPEMSYLGEIAFDLNQELSAATNNYNFYEDVSKDEVEKCFERARFLGAMTKDLRAGFKGKAECYRNALGEARNMCTDIFPHVEGLEYVRNTVIEKVVEDVRKNGHVTPELVKQYSDNVNGISGYVFFNQTAMKYMTDKCTINSADNRMTQAAFAPLAISLYKGTEPKVTDIIDVNGYDIAEIQGMDELCADTERTLKNMEDLHKPEKEPEKLVPGVGKIL